MVKRCYLLGIAAKRGQKGPKGSTSINTLIVDCKTIYILDKSQILARVNFG